MILSFGASSGVAEDDDMRHTSLARTVSRIADQRRRIEQTSTRDNCTQEVACAGPNNLHAQAKQDKG
jgi:hypothetical protein